LTPCGNATVPESHDMNRRPTARTLRRAEYIFILPPGPATHHRPSPAARFLMSVNWKLPKERQNPRSGTNVKDESRGAKPPQTFLECFSAAGEVLNSGRVECHPPERRGEKSLKFRRFTAGKVAFGCWPDSSCPMLQQGR